MAAATHLHNGPAPASSTGGARQVYVHKQQCAITLALTGLTAPSSGRDGNEAEPYAQEAMDFAKDFFYHRDVCPADQGQGRGSSEGRSGG